MAYRLDVREQKKGPYLIIQKKYWDKEKKQSGTKHHQTLGYLHELQKQYPDPITHFKKVVGQMNTSEKADNKLTLEIDMNEKLPNDTHTRYNMGYAVIMKIYHALELDRFFNNKARHEAFEYNTNSIMKLLAITKILHPSSKKKSYEYRDMFFERFDFKLHDIYRALSHFSKIGLECQRYISGQISAKFGRDTTLMYFDVTNLHFEIDETDDMRKYGKEKNNRPAPLYRWPWPWTQTGYPFTTSSFPAIPTTARPLFPSSRMYV